MFGFVSQDYRICTKFEIKTRTNSQTSTELSSRDDGIPFVEDQLRIEFLFEHLKTFIVVSELSLGSRGIHIGRCSGHTLEGCPALLK
jgi:hypothetical protein